MRYSFYRISDVIVNRNAVHEYVATLEPCQASDCG